MVSKYGLKNSPSGDFLLKNRLQATENIGFSKKPELDLA
jgi:hypothetical protein